MRTRAIIVLAIARSEGLLAEPWRREARNILKLKYEKIFCLVNFFQKYNPNNFNQLKTLKFPVTFEIVISIHERQPHSRNK